MAKRDKIMTNPKTCPKYLPADNPARINRDATIAEMNADGMSQVKIAEETGLNRVTVNRILNDNQAKAILQNTTDLHLVAHSAITKQKIGLCFNKDKRIALKAIDLHDQTIGIRGTHTQQNVFVNNLYQQANMQIVSPVILDMLRAHNQDALDIEVPEP